jgi:exodeoxyribonuclease V alpha subunit
MPDSSSTIHRLLGLHPGAVRPRYHRDNPLVLDLLVVDEASMVDLPTMARLLEALPPRCRLVLLGDKDQLASVEAGSVFADITRAGGDSVVLLRRSYRFNDEAGIGALARAINLGQAAETQALLQGGAADLQWQRCSATQRLPALQQVAVQLAALFDSGTPQAALAWLERFRLLCAVRKGPFGVEQVNRDLEQLLRQAGLVTTAGELYRGRPLMITHNAPALGLFNGDVGILWPDSAGSLKAWFPTAGAELKSVSPARLPTHETAWAMTVHKSQGSEFDRVLLLLPPEPNPVLTRELLYTGVTRAREAVELWAEPGIVAHCVGSRVQRASGLAEKLLEL